jgi:hypothetical protein
VNRRSVPGLVLGGHVAELFIDLADAFSGFCELRGRGEWLTEVFLGVGELAACSLDVGERFLLASFKIVEAVFQPGDQANRVDGVQVTGC